MRSTRKVTARRVKVQVQQRMKQKRRCTKDIYVKNTLASPPSSAIAAAFVWPVPVPVPAGSAFERSHTKPFTKVNCSYSQAGVNTYEHLPYPAVNTLFIQCSYSVHTAK